MGKMTIGQMVAQLASGMLISTQIFVITLLFSLPLGLIVAFGRLSKNRVISMIVKFYISIMRGTPLMLQLMVVYFGPYYLFHIKVGSGYRRICLKLRRLFCRNLPQRHSVDADRPV